MKKTKIIGLGASMLLLAATASAAAPYFGTDFGNPNLKGSVSDNGDGTLNITGGGADYWGNSDSGYYYYTWATGQNWDAKMQAIGLTGPDGWTKCELMVRLSDPTNGPAANDAFMAAMVSRDNNLGFQGRPQRGAGCINPGTGATRTDPQWLRILREGAKFTVMVSIDNQVTWVTNRVVDTAAGNDGFSTWPDAITIGVAVTAHNNGDTTGGVGTVSPITGDFGTIVFPTVIGAAVQPQNQTVLVQSEASFTYVTTNNTQPSIPSLPVVAYQWYKNGTALAGATTTIYTFLASQADNGAQIYCKATVNPPFNVSLSSLTSDTATLTVNASTEFSGLKSEFFRNVGRVAVEEGNVPKANWLSRLPGFDDPGGYGDNYVNRVSGWWTPTVSGNYVFYLAADDDTDVYLSTDANPANKTNIVKEVNWNGTRGWTNYPDYRCSSTYVLPDWSIPWANGIPLVAGTKYYIEAVHHNGGGGDNLGLTYRLTTETEWTDWTTNGAPSRLTNGLTFYTWPATTLTWATQPTNTAVYDLSGVTFRCSATTDSELAPAYQWYRNGQIIPNAIGTSYTINPVVFANNNNDTFFVVANTQVGGIFITSQVATLTVLQTVFEPGFAKVEMYAGVTDRMRVENGTAGDPTFITTVPMLGAGTTASWGTDYTRRLSAYFIPPTTGAYDFFIASDDDGDFFLSTDSQPANKRIIANETGWSGVGQWVAPGTGGSIWSQKRSDQYTNAASADLPINPNGIQLTGGTRYYTEIVMHQGGGGDNVEGYWKLHSSPDPVNGAPDNFVGNVIGAPVPRCSYVAFTNQPANQTGAVFTAVTFTANGLTDSKMPIGGNGPPVTNNFMFFQWYKNGTAIAGANQSTYRIDPVLPTDNGAQIYCKMRALGYQDDAGTQLWSNSVTATLTVPTTVFEPGMSQYDVWYGKVRVDVENGNIGTPNSTTYITTWANPGGLGDNYARRFMGFFVPPATDNYVFFLGADDDTDLFLSTDETVGNKRQVAQQVGWASATLNWQGTGGGGDTLATRRSDQFVDPKTGSITYPSGIPLTAGRKYYLETVHHNGGGGDYCSVTAVTKTAADSGSPVNGDLSTLTGASIGTYVKPSTVWFTSQPANVTATSGFPVAFSVVAGTDSTLSMGNNVFLRYQWYKNGGAIPGATGATLNYSPTGPGDNLAQFMCAVRSLGFADAGGNIAWSNSAIATLTFNDSTAPALAYGGYFVNTNFVAYGYPVQYIADAVFSEPMDAASLLAATYTIPGVTVTSKTVNSNNYSVVELQLSGPLTLPATVTVNGAKDVYGNSVAAGASVPVSATLLNGADIGYPGIDPTQPSYMWVTGPKGYIASAQGSDIWTVDDACNFMYETKNGDFDAVVQQKSITRSDYWAKSGLMIRDTIEPTSRTWTVLNTPLTAVNGANQVQCTARWEPSAEMVGWNTSSPVPAYPNAWLRLKRQGQILTAYAGNNGMDWTMIGQRDVSTNSTTPLPQTVLLGIATTAHNNDPAGNPPPYLYYNTSEFDNYSSTYVQPPPRVTLTATLTGGNLTLSWTPATSGSVLQGRADLSTGTWTDIGPANPSAPIPASTGMQFFRVRTPYTP